VAPATRRRLVSVETERAHWENIDPADRQAWICGDDDPSFGAETILDGLGLRTGDTVLDLGCGPGRLTAPIVRHAGVHYFGVDISWKACRVAREVNETLGIVPPVAFMVGDGRTIPLLENTVDAVFSMLLFQHLPGDAVAGYVAEVGRVLRPGGRFVFQWVMDGSDGGEYDRHHPLEHMAFWCADAMLIFLDAHPDPKYPTWAWVRGTRL